MAKTRAKKKAAAKSKSKSKVKSRRAAPKRSAAPKQKAAARKAKAAPKKKPAAKKATAAKKASPARKPAPRAKVSPAIAAATQAALARAEVEGLINRLPPPVQPVVKTLRKLVLEAAPEASEVLDDGAPAYFANGVFARIVPAEREVLVKFMRGGSLPSANELQGEGESRTMSLASLAQLKESVLRKLVREAVMLNLSPPGGPTAQA